MKFYCIVRSLNDISNTDTFELLQKAIEQRGLIFVVIEANNFDYASGYDDFEAGSLIYRLARGDRAAHIEIQLALRGGIGFYASSNALLARHFSWGSAMRLEAAGVRSIPTIYNISKFEDSRLKKYVQQLGGFPIIVKSSGGSHGEGVMKIDSIDSLRSVVGFISDAASYTFVLRKFIHSAQHLRLIVIGDKVVDTIAYKVQEDDFRTNAVAQPEVTAYPHVSESIKQTAIDAVAALDLEFGGVDILFDDESVYYVAEVNFPCNFARNQLNTNVDIAGMMVEYLQDKAVA